MATSFVENVNLLASKVDVVEEANSLFDENVIPVLEEIAGLDLDAAIDDLLKGNYLGNRKIDINLALNVQGITEELLLTDTDQAEAIWTDTSKTVQYDKAIITFTDGEVITLPFIFDNVPVTISTHGDLLAQLSRLDYTYAVAQVDSIFQVNVSNNTEYIISIGNVECKFTSPETASTKEGIIAGLMNAVNDKNISVNAVLADGGSKLNLVAKVPGIPFFVNTSANLTLTNITPNVVEGPIETAFSAKLTGTLAANFAAPVVGEIVRLYDVIGQNSNIERITLHAVSGSYIEEYVLYYWAKTTSAFQTLSMRANDIIKLGNEIDKISKLASRINEVIEIQERLPQLVDTYNIDGVPNGDSTIYNNLGELIAVHSKLNEIVTVYNDIKEYGSNYIEAVALNLKGDNTIGVVATNLQKGNDSDIKLVGEQITKVSAVATNIYKVIEVANNKDDISNVALTVVPHMTEILQADTNAEIATNKAEIATAAAATAVAKSNEIKNVSVGSTVTGVPGTNASVAYNPANGKFTFVIPRGQKGDRGDAFAVNAVGPASNQSLYDSRQTGFSFLAVDTGMIYFKASDIVGDWTLGSPFGKGDKGDPGEDGKSIIQIVFESSNHIDNLPTQPGCIDTYKVAFSDGSFNTFTVYNGKDGDIYTDNVATLTNKTINATSNIVGANHVHTAVVNNTGSIINKGTPVKKATIQDNPNYLCIEPCNDNSQFAIGITYENIEGTTGSLGRIVTTGSVTHVNTIIWEVGDILYIGANGSLTNTKPSTPAYQVCGVVHVKSVTEGVILVNMHDFYNNSSVNLQGDQVISGVKTFASTIVGDITGNAGTVTNGVYTYGNQIISGSKDFSSITKFTAGSSNSIQLDRNSAFKFNGLTFSTNNVVNFSLQQLNNTDGNLTLQARKDDGTETPVFQVDRSTGILSFASNPTVPTPVNINQVTNKDYVDEQISTLNGTLLAEITNRAIPKGIISMWSGSIASIPSGWALCNGENGTPDLRNRFVIGSSSDVSGVSNTNVTGTNTKSGGSKDAIVVSHAHTGTSNSVSSGGTFISGIAVNNSGPLKDGGYTAITSYDTASGSSKYLGIKSASASAHTHSLTINSTGSSGTNANLPPYYALAFIIKL